MSRSVRWASKVLLGLVVTSIVLVGLGQAAHASAPASTAASAPAPAPSAAPAPYTIQLTADGSLMVRTTSAVPAPRVGNPAADEAVPLATWSHKFSQATTRRIWNAVLTGASGTLLAICVALPLPVWIDAIGCPVIVEYLRNRLDDLGNPNGRCLEISISTRLGIPPYVIRLRYVTC